jgi:predicted nucleic acid-binding Zn ribbon protein
MKRNRYSTSGGVAKIGDLLPQLIVKYGLHRQRNLEQIESAWRQAVGKQYAAVTQVSKLHRGTLTIKVPHSAYVQELSFRQSELVDALTVLLQEEKIKKIRFEV